MINQKSLFVQLRFTRRLELSTVTETMEKPWTTT